jgi:hypothetical protein
MNHRGADLFRLVPARRLRVLCGSAADPLNLLQVMLAKGCLLTSLAGTRFVTMKGQ